MSEEEILALIPAELAPVFLVAAEAALFENSEIWQTTLDKIFGEDSARIIYRLFRHS